MKESKIRDLKKLKNINTPKWETKKDISIRVVCTNVEPLKSKKENTDYRLLRIWKKISAESITSISIGKIYDVIERFTIGEGEESKEEYYMIINDIGVRYSYRKSLFKTLDEFRSEKLNILLD